MCDIKTTGTGSQWEMDVRIANILTAVLIVVLAVLATDAGAEEKIYRWVDENGAVHFGDMPPDNAAAEQITVVPDTVSVVPPSAGTAGTPAAPQPSYAEQLRQERAEKRREAEAQQKALDEACAQRKKLVAELEPSPRVIVKNEDGTISRLPDDVRLKTLDEAKAFIAANCNKK